MDINAFRAYDHANTSLGDVNGDGEINVTDVTAFVNLILGSNSIVNVVANLDDVPITFGGGGSGPARVAGNH
ncbi:MAG: hypothetical protein J5548_13800 [Prevotella sp.]|nr:hypothetical protein [Prevotella sp.]